MKVVMIGHNQETNMIHEIIKQKLPKADVLIVDESRFIDDKLLGMNHDLLCIDELKAFIEPLPNDLNIKNRRPKWIK